MKLARLLAPVLALSMAAALAGCSSADSGTPVRYDAMVSMTGMAPHIGQMLEMRIVHVETGVEVGYAKIETVAGASFTVSIPDVLVAGETYHVDWYADMNMNGHYDAPPTDHAWRRTIGPVQGNVSLDFVHDTNWTDIDFPMHG